MNERHLDLTYAEIAKLEDIVDTDALHEVCSSFFDVFGFPVGIVSASSQLLADVHARQQAIPDSSTLQQGRLANPDLLESLREVQENEIVLAAPSHNDGVFHVSSIEYQGRRLGRVLLGPYRPHAELGPETPGIDHNDENAAELPTLREGRVVLLTEHLRRILDRLIFSRHRALLTSEMHIASVRESYRELSKKNAALQDAYDKLKELDRLKSNFLATVSHELRTPLTSIIGYSDMLASGLAGELNEEQSEFVETIRSKGDHLLALISSLLDLGKLEQGNLALECQALSVEVLLHDVVKTLTPQASKREVTLHVDIEEGLPSISADPLRIRQVLFNLAENAIKFSPPQSRVELRVQLTEKEIIDGDDNMGLVLMASKARYFEFAIADSGQGIPEQEKEKVFDAFYQVDGSSTREHGGTGLGLAIVKRLVVAHGGDIWVESQKEVGSTFFFTVPESRD